MGVGSGTGYLKIGLMPSSHSAQTEELKNKSKGDRRCKVQEKEKFKKNTNCGGR